MRADARRPVPANVTLSSILAVVSSLTMALIEIPAPRPKPPSSPPPLSPPSLSLSLESWNNVPSL